MLDGQLDEFTIMAQWQNLMVASPTLYMPAPFCFLSPIFKVIEN